MRKETVLFAGLLMACMNVTAQFWDITQPKRLMGTVNSAAEESMPVFSKDSSILYFTRTFDASNTAGENDQDIWYSTRQSDGSYTECELVEGVNNKYNNAVLGISSDGKAIYLLNSYEGKKDMIKGVSRSLKKGNDWEKPTEILIPGLDIEGDYYGFHVTEDEKVIIISYKGPGSVGEEDLYVSTKNGAEWTQPLHMGSVLNTKGFEISPFLSKGKDTLFFSSNGHGGQGDADIFYSVKQGSWTTWSKPVNLGSKINSPKFDAYFIWSGNHLYWSSNRESEKSDIFHAMTLTPPPVTIACKGINVSVFGGSDGRVDATPDKGVPPYTFSWSSSQQTEDISGLKIGTYTVTVTDAIGQTATCSSTITEPAPPQDITLKHFFDYNADKLTTKEGKLLDFVSEVELMLSKGRSGVTIAINSSASYVPTIKFVTNDKLAASRAKQMEKELNRYFKSKGLDSKVKVVIETAVVQGPAYADDYENQEKYRPYQYIELKTK
ncbi:MAG: SprB repeat-containing protein [Bacteroidota bacterium]